MSDILVPESVLDVEDAAILAQTDLTQCLLLVNAGMQRFSYAIVGPENKRFLALKEYAIDNAVTGNAVLDILEQLIDINKMLYTAFREVRLSFDFPEFTLIPSTLFNPALKKKYLSFLYTDHPEQSIFYDTIAGLNTVNVYAVDKNIVGYLKKEFGTAKMVHSETAFLRTIAAQTGSTENVTYMRVLPGRITLTVMVGEKLIMMQPYHIVDDLDAVYHVLNAWRQLALQPTGMKLMLYGETDENSLLYQELSRHVTEIAWLHRLPAFHYVHAFQTYPAHRFYNLIALASCE